MSAMDIAAKLFGNPARIKVLRLFLSNPETPFDLKLVAKRAQLDTDEVRKEFSLLSKLGLIKPKTFTKETEIPPRRKGDRPTYKRQKVNGYIFDETFTQVDGLNGFLLNFEYLDRNEIAERFKKAGRIKFLALSGVFLQPRNGTVDITIVGDGFNKNMIDTEMRKLEAELGTELVYTVLETQDFLYRVTMYDKFVRDILDFPHVRVIEKVKVR